MSNICVFCGSSTGDRVEYRVAADELGTALAEAGHRLIYGGGHVGLMGVVADSVLRAGGTVTGVMTEQLVASEVAHEGLTSLEITVDMHTRKARMAELADGVIVLPGGFGTLDETFEILTWNQLGLVRLPLVFLDVEGYFDPLLAFVEQSTAAGFVRPAHGMLAQRASDPMAAIALATAPVPEPIRKWAD